MNRAGASYVKFKSFKGALAVMAASALTLGCTGGGNDPASGELEPGRTTVDDESIEPESVEASDEPEDSDSGGAESQRVFEGPLTELLPDDTRGAVMFDLATLAAGEATPDVLALLHGDSADPMLGDLFGALSAFAGSVDTAGSATTALVAYGADAAAGPLLLANVPPDAIGEVVDDTTLRAASAYRSTPLYETQDGQMLALVADELLMVGSRPALESVLDVVAGTSPTAVGEIEPFLPALDSGAHISFVYGMPAMFEQVSEPDLTLRSAVAMSGGFDVVDDGIEGELAFHMPAAIDFVDRYNALNLAATQGDDALEQPLTVADPISGDLSQVVVPVPHAPFNASFDESRTARNLFKKLIVGMDASEYAEGVDDRSTAAWLDFRVQSEADGGTPPSPASVYIRWEFRDQAAIDAFEQNELPAGFRIAPTQFLESDDPAGEYFFALNIYNAGGGSIVSGARAEWDVFVHGPPGADPNAGERPRFMVVEALAEDVSADSGNLLTPAEPLSHELIDGVVVSSVSKFEDGVEVPVFESTFPAPSRETAEVARFTREMAIGNDYIYWEHGVSDRVFYNATTFNHDAFFVDIDQLDYIDMSRWAEYLKPVVKDAVYYENSLEYVASPMANLDSEYLDITPEWLDRLVAFTTNGHQTGLMRSAVEQLFRGEADAFVERRVTNETPSTYYHFEITDPDALETELRLPPGHRLAPITLVEGGAEAHYLTLSVLEFDNSTEGVRAEWSVYTDNGSGRPPRLMVIDLMTADLGFDPVGVVTLPSDVRHEITDGTVSTRLSSDAITFEASFNTASTTAEALTMDWIEAGDTVCSLNDICDKFYYDAETLDVPVNVPTAVEIVEVSTPWNEYVDVQPALVFTRDNAQQYAVNRWHNLDVVVERLPFSGLDNATHEITGAGSLVGRDTDLVDSVYTYTGDLIIDGDEATFALDQEIDNALGIANIYTTGAFDLASGTGTQTVAACIGPALMCSDIETGSTALYTAQSLDSSDLDSLTWVADVDVDLGSAFGIADSSSTFTATRLG